MHRKNFYYATLIVGITAALTIAITLKLSRSRSATPAPPASTASLLARATTPVDEYKGAQKEGIKVHGHWTIDVRNPDGTLVTHREFENALADGGGSLSKILGRISKPGLWQIEFGNSSAFTEDLAWIVEPNDPFPLTIPNISRNLSLCVGGSPCTIAGVPQPTPPPTGTFLLGGNIPAEKNGTIGTVDTNVALCPTSGTLGCTASNQFTFHPLAELVNGSCPPNTQCVVNVVAGQIIQVTVLISFS